MGNFFTSKRKRWKIKDKEKGTLCEKWIWEQEFSEKDEEGNVLLELVTDENGQFSEDIILNKGKFYLFEVSLQMKLKLKLVDFLISQKQLQMIMNTQEIKKAII